MTNQADAPTKCLPDVALQRAGGGSVNPSYFAGHDVIVLFTPQDDRQALDELEQYHALADRLTYHDAYLVAIAPCADERSSSRVAVVSDPGQEAWKLFANGEDETLKGDGAVYLFSRGGCLRCGWSGRGHAREVFAALEDRR